MANCIIDMGYPLGCKDNTGGVKEVYVRTYSSTTVYNYSTDGTITGSTSGATAAPFYKIAARPETAEFKAGTGQHTNDIGNTSYIQTLSIQLTKYQASLRNFLYNLAINDMELIVLLNTGQYVIMGDFSGAYTTESDAGVGKMMNDLNGATVTLQAKSTTPARMVSNTYFNTLNVLSTG